MATKKTSKKSKTPAPARQKPDDMEERTRSITLPEYIWQRLQSEADGEMRSVNKQLAWILAPRYATRVARERAQESGE